MAAQARLHADFPYPESPAQAVTIPKDPHAEGGMTADECKLGNYKERLQAQHLCVAFNLTIHSLYVNTASNAGDIELHVGWIDGSIVCSGLLGTASAGGCRTSIGCTLGHSVCPGGGAWKPWRPSL